MRLLTVQRWLDKLCGTITLVDTVVGGYMDVIVFLNTLGRVGWLFFIFLNRFEVKM